MDLANQVCIVTGATTGIGRAIAETLLARNAKVAICARTESAVKSTVAELGGKDRTLVGLTADVSSELDVNRLRDFVHDKLGPADVLVNNAGIGHYAPVEKLPIKQFDEIMAVNVRGIFLMVRAFLPDMRQKKSGHIVNIASLAGKNGVADGAAYSASKHAVLGFSKS